MSSHQTLIMFIATLIVTAGGIAVLYETTQSHKRAGIATNPSTEVQSTDELTLVNVIGYNIQQDSYKYTRFQVSYRGQGKLNLNDTVIQVQTKDSITDLTYRNGTTTRSLTDGFYTQ